MLFGYRKQRLKDKILKSLGDGGWGNYVYFYKNDTPDNEWAAMCAIVNDIAKDGYIRGNARSHMPEYHIFLDDKGVIFRAGGGYRKVYAKKVIKGIFGFLVASGLIGLLVNYLL